MSLLASFILTVNFSSRDLEAAGTTVDFGAVSSIATSGLYSLSRNPIYAAGLLLIPAASALLSNSLYPLFAHSIWALYLFHVVSVEEPFLAKIDPVVYSAYSSATPRFFPAPLLYALLLLLSIHLLEFAYKLPELRRRSDLGSLPYHFVMTSLWGFVWWHKFPPAPSSTKKKA